MKMYCFLIASATNEDTTGVGIVVALLVVLLVFCLFRFLEPLYAYAFKKPFFVHFYPFPKRLPDEQLLVLATRFSFYKKLPPKQKRYFEHRTCRFIEKYQYIGQQEQPITDEVKVLIAATSVMLTFGMRNYLYTVFDKIIVFPTKYYAISSEAYHIGEFNPALKAIVFSWEDFVAGYQNEQDNRNLGLHEFTHALHFQSTKSEHVSAIIFEKMFRKIMQELENPDTSETIRRSGYFRAYAFENRYEFLAVLLEHFFETPEIFQAHFPQLYDHIRIMINFKHY